MVIAIDPTAFLRGTPPFDQLPVELFAAASRSLEATFHPAGSRLATKGADPLQHVYVIRKGAVRLERDGETIQLLEEGEMFGVLSLISKQATVDVVVESDLLAYRMPRTVVEGLMKDAGFAGHFAERLADRFKHTLDRSQVATFQADLSIPIGQLVRRKPMIVPTTMSVSEAARLVRKENISSLLVDTDPLSIITERDFSHLVVAAELPPSTPIGQICKRAVRRVAAETPIYEAWALLIDEGVSHLAIQQGTELIGVVSANALFRSTAQGPVAVLRRVERMVRSDQLPGYSQRVTEMASALLSGGLDAMVVAGFVARLNDALVHRILRWAEAEIGKAPCSYAWIVAGSEGRTEQTLLTDQDNALLYAEESEGNAAYFQRLSERANEDLLSAGFPECPGGYMAKKWNAPIAAFCAKFDHWVNERAMEGVRDAAVWTDFRKVSGELDVGLLQESVARAGRDSFFLSTLAHTALESKPPNSLLLRLRGESSEVNIKAHGITPVVHLARCYALEVGSDRRPTLERLDAAVRAGLMGKDARAHVGEAFQFLNGLRLRLQLRRLAAGLQPSNSVKLSDLSPIERARLKDSFSAVADWQGLASFHYRAGMY
jgi:CBS domain-containing protein